MKQQLETLPGQFAICRLPAASSTPPWAAGDFVSLTRTDNELSVVCPQEVVPGDVQQDGDWRALRIQGELDLNMVGVLATVADVLAAAGVTIFVVSTFDTDYLLVRSGQLDEARQALRSAGHSVDGH